MKKVDFKEMRMIAAGTTGTYSYYGIKSENFKLGLVEGPTGVGFGAKIGNTYFGFNFTGSYFYIGSGNNPVKILTPCGVVKYIAYLIDTKAN